MTATNQDNDRRRDAEPQPPQPAKPGADQSPPGEAASDIRERFDQVGAILGKGLDLAEAGMNLGVTIVNRIGSVAQKQVLDRMMATAFQAAAAGPADGAPADPGVAAPPGMNSGPPPAPVFCITNRLPLAAGCAVKMSFSINNDSLVAPKKVAVRIEGFAGELTGAALPASVVSVKPPTRTIAPVDFEKFVLRGVIPPQTPADVYLGWVVVDSEEQLRIPLRLTVSM